MAKGRARSDNQKKERQHHELEQSCRDGWLACVHFITCRRINEKWSQLRIHVIYRAALHPSS
jgi:hypothetical protein